MRLSSLLVLTLGPAVAAQSIVIPARANTQPGTTSVSPTWVVYGLSGSHTLNLYSTAEIPTPVAAVSSLALRRTTAIGNVMPATTANLKIVMSMSPHAPMDAKSTYASNHGIGLATVFHGNIALSAQPWANWPAPWEAPFPFTVPFPYLAAAGKSLAIELSFTNVTPTSPWYVEEYEFKAGTHATLLLQPNCRNSTGGAILNWSEPAPGAIAPGRALSYQIYGYPNNVASLNANALCIGLQGLGGSWMGQPLPFSLASLGIASPPSCMWGIDVVASVPLRYVTGSTTPNSGMMMLLSLPIPDDPLLAGLAFYTQVAAVDVDAATSQPTLLPSFVTQWTLGTGRFVPASMVWDVTSGATPPASGTLLTGRVPAIKLN